MKIIIKITTISLMILCGIITKAQNNSVTIGGTETISDAVLWLVPSGNEGKQGLILPITERADFIPSQAGMIIYDPMDQTVNYWNGSSWENLGGENGLADNWGSQTIVSTNILSGAGTISDPLTISSEGASIGQVLKWNGSNWIPSLDETGETGSSVNTNSEIDGDGTLASPLQLAQQAAIEGQVLKWNGTNWAPAEDLSGTGTPLLAGSGIAIGLDNTINNTGDADADPLNELQELSFDVATNQLSLSNGNSVSIPTGGTDADADPTNEIQTLSFDPLTNQIVLSDGGAVSLPNVAIDADEDPSNELQILTFDAATNELTLSNGNTVTIPTGGTDADANPTNELQDLSLSGTTLQISDGTGVDLAGIIPAGGSDDQNLSLFGSELTIENGTNAIDLSVFIDDADADPNNEIQTISLNALTGQLDLSNGGGSVTLPEGTSGAFESNGGVVSPAAQNNDDFVFGSNSIDNDLSTTSDNTRMYFNKTTGAFRAGGSSEEDNWDEGNAGNYSFATGVGTQASTYCSAAFGEGSIASNYASFAQGYYCESSGLDAFAGGAASMAFGAQSFAFGEGAFAGDDLSIALGNYVNAFGLNSTAFGQQTNADAFLSHVIGRFNVGTGSMDEWEGFDPLFEIGNGTSSSDRSNALTVLKNGNIGIGSTEPLSELVVGSNFNFFIPGTSTITVGGGPGSEGGGAVAIGDNDKRFIFRCDGFENGLIAYDSEVFNEVGDFSMDLGQLNIGGNNDHSYKLDIGLGIYAGIHYSRNEYGWEQEVNGANGDMRLFTDADFLSPVASINYTSGAYSALSDRSSKEAIEPIGNVLDKVSQLSPLRYQFKGAQNQKKSLGFIAQDVKEIFPELVTETEGREGHKGTHLMDYSGFGVIALAAIQEQQEMIDKQQGEIETLKEQMLQLIEKIENKK